MLEYVVGVELFMIVEQRQVKGGGDETEECRVEMMPQQRMAIRGQQDRKPEQSVTGTAARHYLAVKFPRFEGSQATLSQPPRGTQGVADWQSGDGSDP